MSSQIEFSVIAPSYSKRLTSSARSDDAIHKFIQQSIGELQPGQWLLAEPVGDFPWELLNLLTDLPWSSEDFEEAARGLAASLGESTLIENGLPIFDFEYSKLVFRHPSFSNGSRVGVLGLVRGVPFLACENDYEDSFGMVSLKDIASYEYFQDSTGAPVSWSGGARLVRVNSTKAFSLGTGDSEPGPEIWDWSLEGELDDDHAQQLVGWLDEYNLVPSLAWISTPVGRAHDDALNRQILEDIAEGDASGLSLSLNLKPSELRLVVEYCPKASELFLPMQSMLSSNKDALLRDLFIYYGLSGMLSDGGRGLEEAYRSFSSARRVIEKYFLLPLSPEEDLPSLGRTRAVISRLENIQILESSGEKLRVLTSSDDHGLRIAGTLISREQSEIRQTELIVDLLAAFRTWQGWRELEAYLPALKQHYQGQDEDDEDDFDDEY